MIPAGHRAVDTAGVAEILGITLRSLNNNPPARRPGFPRGLRRQAARKQLWDLRQVQAYVRWRTAVADGDQAAASRWRALVNADLSTLAAAPTDKLDHEEAAAEAGVSVLRWKERARDGEVVAVDVCGVPHFLRRDVEANPRRAAGRPKGVVETAPRKRPPSAKQAQAAQVIADARGEITAQRLAEQVGASEQSARRWLRDWQQGLSVVR